MGYKKTQVYVAMKRVDARQMAERKKGQVDQGDILRLFQSIKVNIQISTDEGQLPLMNILPWLCYILFLFLQGKNVFDLIQCICGV